MNRIRVLPEEVAAKIAAGEVIDRPASVVKELVENALDAAATEVRVEVQAGGKALVRVADNGRGMSAEDAALCFKRHSTSKISGEQDLDRISTLGFRGEALASISAVARVTLKTSDGAGGKGVMIEREGEKLVSVTDIAFPRGTTVEVRDLFFNLPARRKFLRSDRSELSFIVRTVAEVAAAFPKTRFVLAHGGRVLLDCPAVKTAGERIYQLFGREVASGLMEIKAAEGSHRLDGYASLPLGGRADRSLQHVFVNRRPVRDRMITAALNQAYAGILERNRAPEAFLFFSIPFEEVDVNVHPAKSEVRFSNAQTVFRLVIQAVQAAVAGGPVLKKMQPATGGPAPFQGEGAAEAVAEPKLPWGGAAVGPGLRPEVAAGAGHEGPAFRRDLPEGAIPGSEPRPTGPVRVIGQYENVYIIAAVPEGLLVIDQHNAHERILYDRFVEVDRERAWPVKMLLVSEVVELSASDFMAFEEAAADLEEMGFRADHMGGRSVALKGYPDLFGPAEARDVFLSLVAEGSGREGEERRKRLLAALACKSAVKAGEPLNMEKMSYLVEELFRTGRPALCPHGRPIVLRIERDDLDRGLGRPAGRTGR